MAGKTIEWISSKLATQIPVTESLEEIGIDLGNVSRQNNVPQLRTCSDRHL